MKTIVIIEDHPVLISIYRNKFIAEGFQVEIATDGERGLELINRIKPHLVVLDLAMPKLNGIEVLKLLRSNPMFATLPVIIFSDSAWKHQAWKEGATVVLSKSGNSPSEVVDAAQTALLRSESTQLKISPGTTLPDLVVGSTPTGQFTSTRRAQAQILLVEDHHDIQATISAALNRSGFQVVGVDSHAAALAQVEAREFDAYLLNRLCPDGLGLSLCHLLRQRYPRKPIVMYSTASLPITLDQRLQAGASAYLTEAGDMLDPGRILARFIDDPETTLGFVDSNPVEDRMMLTR